MKQTNEEFIVQLAKPERKYVKVYHDFLRSNLTAEEKIVFIALKSFIDFSKDNGSTQGEAFPTMDTVCNLSSLSRPRATRAINKLIEKKIVKKIRRGMTKSNVYTIFDYSKIWACESVEDMAVVADNEGAKTLTAAEHIAELERMGYTVEIKEKEPTPAPSKATDVDTKSSQSDIADITTNYEQSQEPEKYTMDQIHQHFNYNAMIHDNPRRQDDIDSVMSILYTTINTNRTTIRIGGQDKPSRAVIGKFMKLNTESIMYAIEKFSEQTGRVKNPVSYMLTLLYCAPEQYHLDIKNQVTHDMAHEYETQTFEDENNYQQAEDSYQRTWESDELERYLRDKYGR